MNSSPKVTYWVPSECQLSATVRRQHHFSPTPPNSREDHKRAVFDTAGFAAFMGAANTLSRLAPEPYGRFASTRARSKARNTAHSLSTVANAPETQGPRQETLCRFSTVPQHRREPKWTSRDPPQRQRRSATARSSTQQPLLNDAVSTNSPAHQTILIIAVHTC